MKVRKTTPGTAGSVRLTVVSCATLTVLVSATVSACTGSGPTSPNIPTPTLTTVQPSTGGTKTPTPTAGTESPTETHSPTHTATPTEHPTGTATPTHTATETPSATPTPTPEATTPFPTAAPSTGGGGTAGLQDGLLFGLGGTAMLAGLGSLAYRRRVNRDK
jgi:hypothetical protein